MKKEYFSVDEGGGLNKDESEIICILTCFESNNYLTVIVIPLNTYQAYKL